MPARTSSPKPWPMKWIVVAIIVCVIPYTWITLRHRKPGPAYLPYADNKSRAEVMRLLDAGYRRIEILLEKVPDGVSTSLSHPAPTSAGPGGLPPPLNEALIDKPLVPTRIGAVQATVDASSAADTTIRFTCTPPEDHHHLARVILFARDSEITLVPVFETLHGERPNPPGNTLARAVIPAGTLKPRTYRFTLVGADESRTWNVEFR